MKILVAGGAGYVGSHVAKRLAHDGIEVHVLDNLSTGHREAVLWGRLIEADLLRIDSLDRALSANRYHAVMHFCSRSLVGESVSAPYDYYHANVVGTLNLLEAMKRHHIGKLVFSSSAAVFGNPDRDLIDETHPRHPINPYGKSKLMVESILEDAATAYGLRSVALRYFNAAGADPSGRIGESRNPETHVIPNMFRSVLGHAPCFTVLGDDYPTSDGTCIRDYVHVNDIAEAHLEALHWLAHNEGSARFNVGNGVGFSVREVLAAAEHVIGRKIAYEIAPRRKGDPAILVASIEKARTELGWRPRYSGIEDILSAAWAWHQNPAY
ncbi:UDP-glucose 4-epimerase GalE [Xanthomonas pisi]|uniref:UDP-glucose 4-epimerase n=1 Tax=Xanthomonas pisi TaxID=56457 RepID=A0A2S7D5S9_9XANT|nr:UDP-glucose 4-epimerase GalE [Xanthomonas pisi]KLD70919.1 UDP-galactose-4-epimerase [Xanthomonas pisi DSM 18956]PPU69167.1 UDP-glucose 4-epimerase [Xanthomonas pisi]